MKSIKGDIKMWKLDLKEQKKTKPMIEDVMPHYLDGGRLKNALEFIAYLRENKIKPVWAITNGWKAVYKGKTLYYIRLPLYEAHFNRPNQLDGTNWESSWCVTPFLMNLAEYEDLITDETDKKIVVDNFYGCVPYCRGSGCSSEKKITVCGTELVRYCHDGMLGNRSLWVVNPDETEIACIKKFLELEKNARNENADRIKKIRKIKPGISNKNNNN
jgi:hypothetical protein